MLQLLSKFLKESNHIMKNICYIIPKAASNDDEVRRMLASGSSLLEFDINLTLMGCSGISILDLPIAIKKGELSAGDYILVPYARLKTPLVAWKVLNVDGSKAMVSTLDAIDFMQFSAKDSNNYAKSDIRKWLLSSLPKKLPKEFVSLVKPYTSRDRIIKGDNFWLLGRDELENYYPTFRSRVKHSLIDYSGTYYDVSKGEAAYWWLRNPNTGLSYVEYYVSTSGGSGGSSADYSGGCVPACILG